MIVFSRNSCLDPEVNRSSAVFSAKQAENSQHILLFSNLKYCWCALFHGAEADFSGCDATRAPAATKIGVSKCL